MKDKHSVTILPDKEGEKFSHSNCNCDECRKMHLAQLEWDTFIPKNRLQKRMMDVIKKIEQKYT